MKLIHFAAAGGFALLAACSDRPADTPREPATPVATARDAPPSPPSPPAAPRPAAEPTELADARNAPSGPATQAAARAGVNTDAAVQQEFKSRVDAYVALHERASRGDARLKQTENAGDIAKAQDALAAGVIALRPNARQGDIFSAEIRDRFRRLLAPELKGAEGRDARAVMKDDAPAPGSIPFTVNAKYPDAQPKPTVPGTVLAHLPALPRPLEYRVIGRHLLLLDTDANVIVDYIPNAIP
jgi:hypothetical protein